MATRLQQNLQMPLLFEVWATGGAEGVVPHKERTRQDGDGCFELLLENLAALYELPKNAVRRYGQTQFENSVRFARKQLEEAGLLEKDPHLWKIALLGEKRIREFVAARLESMSDEEVFEFIEGFLGVLCRCVARYAQNVNDLQWPDRIQNWLAELVCKLEDENTEFDYMVTILGRNSSMIFDKHIRPFKHHQVRRHHASAHE